MRIFNETKTYEMLCEQVDIEKGYLKLDKLFIKHHEAVPAQEAVYNDRIEHLPNGSTQTWKELKTPAVEAKEAYDEYENIQVYTPYTEEQIKQNLRRKREIECFPIINRGQLWHDGLTDEQRAELKEWYIKWLDITETLVVPEKPKWLK